MSLNVQDLCKRVSSLERLVREQYKVIMSLARNHKPKEDMSGAEVMEELHISKSTLGKLRRSGVIMGYTSTGRNFYYKRAEVEAYKSGQKASDIFQMKHQLKTTHK